MLLRTFWSGWRDAVVIVKPETLVGWHRAGFRLYWSWKSRPRAGRPKITPELRALIRRLAQENTGWGAPKIHGDFQKLGLPSRNEPSHVTYRGPAAETRARNGLHFCTISPRPLLRSISSPCRR